ncbi:MAG TPA: ATP-binding protein [Myxococcaceae bacterium]|nr:ATP-binding protein [Myxococcaceae bacterium]
MSSPSASERDVSGRTLSLAFAAVVGAFFATSFIVQRSSDSVAQLSESIIYNSAPSIEHLTSVRRAVLEAELTMWNLLHEPERHPDASEMLEAQRSRVEESTHAYLRLPPLPGEQSLRSEVQTSWLRFDNALQHARELAQTGPKAEARTLVHREVEAARRQFLEHVTRAIELNAVNGREMAAKILETRRQSNWLANGLNVVCGVLAAVVAWLLHRQVKSRRALAEAQTKSLERRAEELEQFSGRVAHDIRNPVSAARMAAELALRKTTDESVREAINRILRSLSRADAITTALLDFARAGAKPDPGARIEPRAVIKDMLGGMEPEAEAAGIELHTEPVPPVLVACSTGVYLSLLGNLVRNSIKYMGDSPTRRITVRVVDEHGSVRTEVSDTGPGIASESLPVLFDPYFREHRTSAEGLGLGLATVKKLAEGHGGQVGVVSERGKGTTIWFTLQRAGTATPLDGAAESAPPPVRPPTHH